MSIRDDQSDRLALVLEMCGWTPTEAHNLTIRLNAKQMLQLSETLEGLLQNQEEKP